LVAITLLAILSIYTLYSYSTALYAFISPTVSPAIGVTTYNTYTTADVQVDTFARGANARIKATLEKATWYLVPYAEFTEPSYVKVSIAVYYTDTGVVKLVKFYTTSMTLQPGVSQTVNVDFQVPSSGLTGSYSANIFVWDDYLPSGGVDQIDTTNSAGTVPQKVFTVT
jgi:hypothetical protein